MHTLFFQFCSYLRSLKSPSLIFGYVKCMRNSSECDAVVHVATRSVSSLIKDIINLYFTKFAVICLSPSISPSNQHINGCFILTENWYALPMVFFLLLGTQNKMTRYHILKYLGPKACQSTCSYLFWSRNI